MKRNLLDKEAAEMIVTRVKALDVTATANWGDMNATEMLLHCNLTNKAILDKDLEYHKTTFKQQVIKILGLYVLPNFPRNIKTALRNVTKGKLDKDRFEEQRAIFIATVRKFAELKDPIQLTHPAFGNLNTKQWGLAAWKHNDHHLRQFGV